MGDSVIPKEVFLYRCDRCNNVTCLNIDRGGKFYMYHCISCKEWSDHEKIVTGKESNMYREGRFFISMEEKDVGSQGTEEEG